MKVHILNHMVHDIVVHRVGCADIERERAKRRLNSDWILDIADDTSVAEAVAADLSAGFGWTPEDEEPAPWRAEHIRVMPCVGKKGGK